MQSLTNVSMDLCTAQGAVMVQMFPWGWQLPGDRVDRECMFSHQAEAVGARYFRWLSTDRLKGLKPMCAAHVAMSA